MNVGFIGLGSMGGDQARQIARSNFNLSVFDVFADAMQKFQGMARLASSPADAARDADIVHICVRDDKQVADTIFGPDGVAGALEKGKLIVVHSTIRIDTVTTLKTKLAEQGLRFIDAPVSRTRIGEDGRFVITLIGGDEADAEYARPILETFSTEIRHIGPNGSAMALKICNNLVTWTQLMVGVQAANICAHFDVPFENFKAVTKANGNLTPSMDALLGGMQAIAPGTNADYDALMTSQAGIGEKDLELAIACGEAAGLDMTMAKQTRSLVRPTFERHRE